MPTHSTRRDAACRPTHPGEGVEGRVRGLRGVRAGRREGEGVRGREGEKEIEGER